MKRLNLLMLICFAAVTLVAEGNKRIVEGLSMQSAILGQEVKYSIVLPADYFKTKKKYPVVYLLHGLGDDESSWLEYGRIAQITDKEIGDKEITSMIFVMPQGFRNYYVNDFAGNFLYEDMFIQELVPFIDNTYRTIQDNTHRAVMGYSMGGFGALMLPARHPDVFSVSVPLSVSVRTDAQYMVEDASEWNDQWGRLFGGVGKTGTDRITEYYKQYSPFHFFNSGNANSFLGLRLFIDNGDDEQTLCRSNEELHILLRNLGIRHQYRVRNGGHEFSYWRDALPDALRFISDSFEGKAYRGDIMEPSKRPKYPKVEILEREGFSVVLPPGYAQSSRKYPVIYLFEDFTNDRIQAIAGLIHKGIKDGTWPEMILIFLNKGNVGLTEHIIPQIETGYNARIGYRFRALVGFEEGGVAALQNALTPLTFTSCVLFDAPVNIDLLKQSISLDKSAFKRTWLLISTTDTDLDYETNGKAHMLLRDEDIYHEYRVVEGGRSVQVTNDRLKEAFQFTSEKIHR
ncbi:MAG TPA: alpha/beta hydrolase-fold protein [Saprospiraceae bacterium]|nr:alpha/beta hydrolase-fold protein [Saprospiraceae bacterium]